MIRRPLRFALPLAVVSLLQWQLCAQGHTDAAASADAQLLFSGSGLELPGWCRIDNSTGWFTFQLNQYTRQPTDEAIGSLLWTLTWSCWGSYCVYLVFAVTHLLPSSRYYVFASLLAFSWATYSYNWAFLLGYIVFDLVRSGQLEELRTRYQRQVPLFQVVAIAVGVVIMWVFPIRDGLDSGLGHVNVSNIKHIPFSRSIFVFLLILVLETNTKAQRLLSNRLFRILGKLAPGIFVLHPIFVYTIIPNLAVSMNNNGNSFGTIIGVSWLVVTLASTAAAVLFHFAVEIPSEYLGYAWLWLLGGESDMQRRQSAGLWTAAIDSRFQGKLFRPAAGISI